MFFFVVDDPMCYQSKGREGKEDSMGKSRAGKSTHQREGNTEEHAPSPTSFFGEMD